MLLFSGINSVHLKIIRKEENSSGYPSVNICILNVSGIHKNVNEMKFILLITFECKLTILNCI